MKKTDFIDFIKMPYMVLAWFGIGMYAFAIGATIYSLIKLFL